jgi:hypothetical protein
MWTSLAILAASAQGRGPENSFERVYLEDWCRIFRHNIRTRLPNYTVSKCLKTVCLRELLRSSVLCVQKVASVYLLSRSIIAVVAWHCWQRGPPAEPALTNAGPNCDPRGGPIKVIVQSKNKGLTFWYTNVSYKIIKSVRELCVVSHCVFLKISNVQIRPRWTSG